MNRNYQITIFLLIIFKRYLSDSLPKITDTFLGTAADHRIRNPDTTLPSLPIFFLLPDFRPKQILLMLVNLLQKFLLKLVFLTFLKYDNVVLLRFKPRRRYQYILKVLKSARCHYHNFVLVFKIAQEIDCSRLW